jgi:preprotein translocase subunit SecB
MAKFRFKDYKIVDASIHISPDGITSNKMSVEMKPQSCASDSDLNYKLQLDIKISNSENQFSVFVSIIGLFEFDSDLEPKAKENFFKINAPSILFPYVRAYISTLTSLSGMVPVILPTINIVEAMKNLEVKVD